MTPNRYWESVSSNKDLDLPIFGAMGKASSVALGLALARPDKRIVVLDGDGGLLMNLGSLVTIADQEPDNLVHFVFEDGMYFTTGGQPVPGAGQGSTLPAWRRTPASGRASSWTTSRTWSTSCPTS